MTDPTSNKPVRDGFDAKLIRGTWVNTVGLLVKVISPAFFVMITWLFGPSVVGMYILVTSFFEVIKSGLCSGFADGVTIYASHYADASRSDSQAQARLAKIISLAMLYPVGLGILAAVAIILGAQPLAAFLSTEQDGLADALRVAGVALPLAIFSQIAVSATKAKMLMEYEVGIQGLVRQLSLVLFGLLAWQLRNDIVGLMLAYLGMNVLITAFGIWALRREFELSALVSALQSDTQVPGFARFSLFQSVNLTLNRYVSKIAVFALGIGGASSLQIAFFGTAELVAGMLKEIKILFSNSMAPIAARYHGAGDSKAFVHTMSKLTRWSLSIIIPIVLIVTVLRNDILRFVNEAYVGDTTFAAILMLQPLLYCGYGLAVNCITFTKHSGWSLFNTAVTALIGTGLCWWLIPSHGLTGAAIATTIAVAYNIGISVLELYSLERMWVPLAALKAPHLALGVMAVVLALFWDPAALPALWMRAAFAAGSLLLYIALLYATGHPEVRAWRAWRARGQDR